MPYLTNEASLKTAVFGQPQIGWREATPEEINAYLLDQAKARKLAELDSAFSAFEAGGHIYEGYVYCLKQDSIVNIGIVSDLDSEDPNAYTFRDIAGVVHDFVDQAGWDAFRLDMTTERNRIMVYRVAKKSEINACSTTAEMEAVIIDFSA